VLFSRRRSANNANDNDPLSPAERKLAALLDDPDLRSQLLQSPRPPVTLKDEDGDGIYTGEYTDTNQEGIYHFTFLIEGSTPDNGSFTRTETRTLHVSTKPSPQTTTAAAELMGTGEQGEQTFLVKFTLFDALGNYLGPGFEDFIKVTPTQGTLVGEIVDNLDGSYQQRLALTDPSADPKIVVEVLGTTVVNKSLNELQGKVPPLYFNEAEDLELNTYLVEKRSVASGEKVITLLDASGNEGTASTTFEGPSGVYTVVVGYFDESDGESLLRLKVNDDIVDNWRLDQKIDPDGDVPTKENFTRRTIGGVELNPKDVLSIEGFREREEYARVDFIQIIPVNVSSSEQ
jgi:hypothetical protein